MKKAILFLSLFVPLGAHGESERCGEPANPQDIINCVTKNHPDILGLQAKAENLNVFSKAASQRPNPELDSEAIFRSESDEPDLTLEAAYLHTFELGSKRRKRLGQAKAQERYLLAQLERTKGEVVLESVLNLHRLRHLEMELHVVEESLDTFKKIIKQYKKRRSLSPEQEVSLNVFILAEGDYRLDQSNLLQEKEEIKTYFDLSTDIPFDQITSVLPKKLDQWPEIKENSQGFKSAAWKEATSERDLSKAELDIAKAQAWPDMQLGPKIELESGNGSDSQGIGAALSMPLPLYNRNKGTIGIAKNQATLSEIQLTQTEKKLDSELVRLKNVYQRSVKALKKTPTLSDMESKHKKMESLFQRGLVSAPLIIEAHRQMTEFTENQNEHELGAIEALWSIYKLEGRIFEETLQ